MSKWITIKEIAEKASVSVGTVDRVLHNRGEVAKDTMERIQRIAGEGNYKTNVFARSLKLNKTFRIAVVIPGDNEYWNLQLAGVKQGFLEFESLGIGVDYYLFDRLDENTFVNEVNMALQAKSDGMILAPIVANATRQIAKKLVEIKMPFVFVDSNLSGVGALCFIGQDALQSGYLAAKLLDFGNAEQPRVFILTITGSDQHNKTIHERIEGFKSYYWSQHPDVVLHEHNLSSSDEVSVFLSKLNALDHYAQLFVPFSRSHEVAGHLSGLDKSKYRFVGYDLINKNIPLVEDGTIDFLIHQKPMIQGYRAIKALYQHLIAHVEVASTQYMPIDLITKENLKYYEA
jgi:LacI family transcriptional regulator